MFDLNFTKLLLLAVVALVVFGPERLPGLAAQAGRTLRQLRVMLDGAKSELQGSLPPEFSQFDINDLNPKSFVRKHLVEELTGDGVLFSRDGIRVSDRADAAASASNGAGAPASSSTNGSGTVSPSARLALGEAPPYDAEAT